MLDFIQLLNLRSQGTLLRPSILIGAFAQDMSQTIDRVSKAFKITLIPSLIKEAIQELKQVPSFYDIPFRMVASPSLYRIHSNLIDICWSTVTILAMCSLAAPVWRSIAYPIIPGFVEKPIDMDQKTRFIQKAKVEIRDWNLLIINGKDIRELKEQASSLCSKLINHIREVNQTPATTNLENILQQLTEVKGQLEAVILDPITEKEDPPEGPLGSSLFEKLGTIGFTNSDFQTIAIRIGWNQDEFSYLPLRFAEKGIFSFKDLENLKSLSSKNEQIQSIVELLQYPVTPRSSEQLRWELIKQAALQIDRIAASIFAVGFQLFSLVEIYHGSFILKFLSLIDGVYMGSRIGNIRVSRSDFVNGNLIDRIYWMIAAQSPVYSLSYIVTRAIKGPGIRALPGLLYETYLS